MMEESALNFWLHNNGFDNNPFASKEADFEAAHDQSRVVDYFVRAVWFDQILGEIHQPRSAVLSARRGCGKSASRLMVEYECQHGRMAGKVLTATYVNFERALTAWQGKGDLNLHQVHLHCVLELCSLALVNYLREHPEQVANLGYGGGYRLGGLLVGYTTFFEPFHLDEVLHRINADEQVLNSKLFLEAVWSGTLKDLLDSANVGRERPWLELLGQAAGYTGSIPELNRNLFEDLYRLVRMVGLQAIYVLIDRVDELPETAADPAAGAELLRPLLADLRLMELPGFAFKFFLPNEVSTSLFTAKDLRSDRLTRYEIGWNSTQLISFLHNRLLAYSRDNSLNSLAPFCEVGFAEEVDEEISQLAEGSPRNLLRLGELFIIEHCQGTAVNGPLRREELEQAYQKLQLSLQHERTAYSTTLPPPVLEEKEALPEIQVSKKGLYLDSALRQVWSEGQLLKPGPIGQEYTLLEYLYQHANRAVSKDELLQAIYGSDTFLETSEEALSQLISRLRKKIEPNQKSGQNSYIKTVPRFGYKLENKVQD
ncbi:MAG: winged helix-turn-helix domain-containing protein [Chloroflexota bacterium]